MHAENVIPYNEKFFMDGIDENVKGGESGYQAGVNKANENLLDPSEVSGL